MIAAKIEDVVKHNFYNHFISHRPASGVLEVSDTLLGLHSARLITPYATLISRIDGFKTRQLYDEVTINTNLIKLRCMRKTLHTVSMELAPIVYHATLKLRTAECTEFYRRFGYSGKKIASLKERMLGIIDAAPSSSADVAEKVNSKWGVHFTRVVLKELWEEGTICYINESEDWRKEKRKYALTKSVYPKLDFTIMDEVLSQEILVLKHIESYGPVTEKDISWWSGIPLRSVRKIIDKNRDKIVNLEISGFDAAFYMSALRFETNVKENKNGINDNWIALLAYEDPSLKGYFESRSRYIEDKYYHLLFNSIGEARASIVKNGKVIGIWHWNKKTNEPEFSLFTRLNKQDKQLLSIEIDKFKMCLQEQLFVA